MRSVLKNKKGSWSIEQIVAIGLGIIVLIIILNSIFLKIDFGAVLKNLVPQWGGGDDPKYDEVSGSDEGIEGVVLPVEVKMNNFISVPDVNKLIEECQYSSRNRVPDSVSGQVDGEMNLPVNRFYCLSDPVLPPNYEKENGVVVLDLSIYGITPIIFGDSVEKIRLFDRNGYIELVGSSNFELGAIGPEGVLYLLGNSDFFKSVEWENPNLNRKKIIASRTLLVDSLEMIYLGNNKGYRAFYRFNKEMTIKTNLKFNYEELRAKIDGK